MKKLIVGLTVLVLVIVGVLGLYVPSYASDWDKAGKAFAILEGVRVITRGGVDIIGTITGINQNQMHARQYHKHYHCRPYRVWIPRMIWKRKYIPEHTEYSEEYGEIIVEGHYIRYQVEKGGHWASRYSCN